MCQLAINVALLKFPVSHVTADGSSN